MEFQIDEKNIELEYERLSNLLLLETELNINETRIRLTEIEFYFYSENHKDGFTHVHQYPAGRWRFHNQGFDITLKGNSGFGGILIRGVEINGHYFNGPRRVLFEIMRYLNPVNQTDNVLGLVRSNKRDLKIFKTFRHGLKSDNPSLACSNPDYFINANYRFIVNQQAFDKKHFTDSEKIAKGFKDMILSQQFLGYNLK